MSKRDPESSLELLLDTMCNTFGGVMFIAISLLVLISMLSSGRLAETVPPSVEELRAELSRTERRIDEEKARQEQLRKRVLAMEIDPRRKAVSELLLLEEERKLTEIQLSVETEKNSLLVREWEKLRQQDEEAERKLNSLSEEERKNSAAIAALIQEVEQLRRKRREVTPPRMTFRMIEKRRETPYFILLSGNRAWRIGPERMGDGTLKSSDECTERVSAVEDGEERFCTGKPDRGTEILDASGKLSGEMLRMLETVPAGRGIKFFLHASGVRSFLVVREYLNRKKRFHGVTPEFHPGDTCLYFVGKKEQFYEY